MGQTKFAEQRQRRLELIFDAFRQRVAVRGYTALTLSEVAEHAGFKRTSMYKYFDTKEALLRAYALREVDELHSALRAAIADVDGPLDQLDAFVATYAEFVADHWTPVGPMVRGVLPVEVQRELHDHELMLDETLAAILEEAASAGLCVIRR